MNPYIEKLKAFLAGQSPVFKYEDANSILELLCYYYCSANSVDNAVIRCQYRALDDALPNLSLDAYDTLFAVTADLCASYERKAFLDGVVVGMHLFEELNNMPASQHT